MGKKRITAKRAEKLNDDQIITLMGIYLSEWEHRDESLWNQIFKLFYANLVVIMLPNIAEAIGIELPTIPEWIFPFIGMLMGGVFFYAGMGYAIRLRASSKTYQEMMKLLPHKKYRRFSLKDTSKTGFLFEKPVTYVLIIAMFIALEAVAITLIALSVCDVFCIPN